MKRAVYLSVLSVVALCAATVILPASVAGAVSSTSAGFSSQAGDYIGQGHAYAFPTVTFTGLRGGYPTFDVSNGTDLFSVWIAAAAGSPLTVGSYNDAQRFDFRAPGHPGLDISGDGRGCNTVSGSFTVFQATYGAGGVVDSFAAQFVEHCEGQAPALDGYISFNSTVSMPTWLVASTSTLAFPATRVGTGSELQNVSLDNLGGSPTTISDFSFSGADPDDFIGESTCLTTLAPGQSCGASMSFVPGAPGPRSAVLAPVDPGATVPQITMTGTAGVGYYIADQVGDVLPYGDAAFYGDMGSAPLNSPIVSMTTTDDGFGYWLLGQDGGIFSFGDASFFGSTGNIRLNRPVVSMVATPDGGGYWFVASDGGIFAFGDARFYGSMGGHHLNQPIVGMATTPDGHGYWLVARDGGMFSFGDARFYGSMGAHPLNSPIVGMAPMPDGRGYWLVAGDGGMFSFGTAKFHGSTGSFHLGSPIVSMAPTWDGGGYWLLSYTGGVYAFGDAPFYGAPTGEGGVAIAGTAPPTLQAILDIPAIRARLHVGRGWQVVAAPRT